MRYADGYSRVRKAFQSNPTSSREYAAALAASLAGKVGFNPTRPVAGNMRIPRACRVRLCWTFQSNPTSSREYARTGQKYCSDRTVFQSNPTSSREYALRRDPDRACSEIVSIQPDQ